MVLELLFGTRAAFETFMKDLTKEVGIKKNVVRGRVTSTGAWMKIALFGDAGAVDALRLRWIDSTLTAVLLPKAAA